MSEKRLDDVLVTGAAGHLGSHLIPELVRAGFIVTGVDLADYPAERTAPHRFVKTDLTDRKAIDEILRGADLIVHCASIHPWKPYTDDQYLDANIKGTWHLYASAAEQGIERVVLTSSIAAVGYPVSPEHWPVTEAYQGIPGDLYSLTKHAQETVARQFAAQGRVRTIALRPPAFMPRPDLETGFGLLGAFARVEDMVSAHLAAVRVLAGRQPTPDPLQPFEPFFCTLPLPYTAAEGREFGGSVTLDLARRYWPQATDWLAERGFQGAWLPGVYDISRTRRLLGWEPRFDFDGWFARQEKR